MSDHPTDLTRRSLLTGAAAAVALAPLVSTDEARGQSAPAASPGLTAGTDFGPLKQVETDVLSVGYVDAGSADGPPVVLLHGWPYDIHSYAEVVPLLVASGHRVLVPYLRGYGTTRFLSADTMRNGQQAALAVDVLAFMDALRIEKAVIAGYDWGARTACILAALWPERCQGLVSVSGYLIGSQEANRMPLPPEGRAAMVVPVLLRHGARSGGLRQVHEGVRSTHLGACLPAMALRRGHLCPLGGCF